MRCLQCGKRVSLLRKLTDGEFCSDEHRHSFQQQQNDLALARLIEAQQGMTRPAAKAAAAAKAPAVVAKPAKPSGKAAETENIPPFGPFLTLLVAGLRLRRIHAPEVHVLHAHIASFLPAIEFRTRIQGVRWAFGVEWAGARSQSIAGAPCRWDGASLSLLNAAGGCALPAAVLRVEEIAWPKAVAPVPVEAPVEEPQADPPLAPLLGVVTTAPAATVAARQAALSARPAFAKPGVRWIPVRGEQDTPPAPEAGLLPVSTAACAAMPGAVASPCQPCWSANHLPADTSAAARFSLEQPLFAASAVLPLPEGSAVPAGVPRLAELDSAAAWAPSGVLLPAGRASQDGSPAPVEAGLRRLEALTAVTCAVLATSGARTLDARAAAASEVELPGALTQPEAFDFWTWLEILTAPPAARELEATAEAGLVALSASDPLGLPLRAAVVAAAAWQTGAPVFESLGSGLDSRPWGELLERGAEVAVLTDGPAVESGADPEEVAGPPLHLKLSPILAWRLSEPTPVEVRQPASCRELIWRSSLESVPQLPRTGLRPDNAESAAGEYAPPRNASKRSGFDLRSRLAIPASWKVWQHAPADLKWVAVGLPLILALVLYSFRGSQPKEQAGVKLASSQSQSILGTQFSSLQKVIMQRAAIHLMDDFRSGLSAWEGKPGWAKSWKYGQATFLEPGQLAVYKPTLAMQDYTLEFLGQIERQSLSWVVRADDKLRNYHVMRLVVTRPGPLPEAAIQRYTVADGREGPVTTLPLPFPIKLSTMHRVRVEVRGKEITTYLQGQVVDSFTDTHLRAGGVGFFSPKGEKALLRWVEVTHQYDYLGRFCALLAPYDVQAGAERAD